MDNLREKLAGLIDDHTCLEDKDSCPETCSACLADHLIANGVTVQSDEELAKFLDDLAFARETPWIKPFVKKFCDNCPTIRCVVEELGKEEELNECDFGDGKCPHGNEVLWWLKEPVEEVKEG